MQVFANNFAIHKSKHTKGLNLDRIASKLSDAIMFYDKETELWKEMVDTNITNTDAFDILAHLSDAKSAQAHLKQGKPPRSILYEPDVVRNKTLSNLYYYWIHNSQSNSLGSTAWALYNSMTEWATHQKPRNRNSLNNVASLRVDRFEKVRKTLNNKMIPQLKLVA